MRNPEERKHNKTNGLFAIGPEDLTVEAPSRSRVDIAAISHPGLVRETNEDHYLVIRFQRMLENLSTNIPKGSLENCFNLVGYGILVADGMGGMAGGEVASSLALQKIVELLVDTPDWIMSLRRLRDLNTVIWRMTERFQEVDSAIRSQAEEEIDLRGMGTTLTVVGMLGKDLVIGHVGDSRAYLFRDGNLLQLTSDHTLAQRLIDAGVAKPDDPAARSMRHVLTSAVGSFGDKAEPQIHHKELAERDQILVCTDGLTDMLNDSTIASVLSESRSSQNACQALTDLALSAGGLDNVTVVVARLGSAQANH
jgi:protein phosphatase